MSRILLLFSNGIEIGKNQFIYLTSCSVEKLKVEILTKHGKKEKEYPLSDIKRLLFIDHNEN